MATAPVVSVVMSALNSADSLERTLDSILQQEHVDLEFVVVNDGSTDGTRELLDRRARSDHRLRPLHQDNSGLTTALARGCQAAKGKYIARQDAGGDISLPGRLQLQQEFLDANADAAMVSCGTRFVGPSDEKLFDSMIDDAGLDHGLSTLSVPGVSGPSHHGATMFRADAYARVGGYRPAFPVAQDLDLWLRLFEVGACRTIPAVHYQARHTLNSISSRNGDRQLQFAAIAVECARHRRAGLPEPTWPDPAANGGHLQANAARSEPAAFYYFIASCLRASDKAMARKYLYKALRAQPTHTRAWWRLLQSWWIR